MFNFFVRRKLPKETIVEFDKLEGHPSLPTAAAAAAAASAANNPNSQQSQVCDLSRFLQCHTRFLFPLRPLQQLLSLSTRGHLVLILLGLLGFLLEFFP